MSLTRTVAWWPRNNLWWGIKQQEGNCIKYAVDFLFYAKISKHASLIILANVIRRLVYVRTKVSCFTVGFFIKCWYTNIIFMKRRTWKLWLRPCIDWTRIETNTSSLRVIKSNIWYSGSNTYGTFFISKIKLAKIWHTSRPKTRAVTQATKVPLGVKKKKAVTSCTACSSATI